MTGSRLTFCVTATGGRLGVCIAGVHASAVSFIYSHCHCKDYLRKLGKLNFWPVHVHSPSFKATQIILLPEKKGSWLLVRHGHTRDVQFVILFTSEDFLMLPVCLFGCLKLTQLPCQFTCVVIITHYTLSFIVVSLTSSSSSSFTFQMWHHSFPQITRFN